MSTATAQSNSVLNAESSNSFEVSSTTKLTLVVYLSLSSPQSLSLLPHLRRWQQLYAPAGLGITIASIPQFAFERSDHFQGYLTQLLDPAWSNARYDPDPSELWPRVALLGSEGTLLHSAIGFNACVGAEEVIHQTLMQSGSPQLPPKTVNGGHRHRLGSQCLPSHPDSFAGLRRAQYKNSAVVAGNIRRFVDPLDMATFGLSLNGLWQITDERAQTTPATQASDYISYVFAGCAVSAVLEPLGTGPATLTLTLNGQSLTPEQAGVDVSLDQGVSTIQLTQPRLYQLVSSQDYLAPADLRLHPQGEQLAVYLLSANGCRRA